MRRLVPLVSDNGHLTFILPLLCHILIRSSRFSWSIVKPLRKYLRFFMYKLSTTVNLWLARPNHYGQSVCKCQLYYYLHCLVFSAGYASGFRCHLTRQRTGTARDVWLSISSRASSTRGTSGKRRSTITKRKNFQHIRKLLTHSETKHAMDLLVRLHT